VTQPDLALAENLIRARHAAFAARLLLLLPMVVRDGVLTPFVFLFVVPVVIVPGGVTGGISVPGLLDLGESEHRFAPGLPGGGAQQRGMQSGSDAEAGKALHGDAGLGEHLRDGLLVVLGEGLVQEAVLLEEPDHAALGDLR
jgi:hypothetical protein